MEFYSKILILIICSTRYVHSIDNSWGSLEKDGTFNGIIGMLNRSETEVGIASFVMTLTRSWGAQHLKPFTIYGYLKIIDP